MFTSPTKLFQSITPAVSTGAYQISRSLRFNSADSAFLNRTPASATNRQTWTWSGWVKPNNIGTVKYKSLIEGIGPSPAGTRTTFIISDNGTIQFFTDNASTSLLVTTQVLRDFSAWYHIVLAVDTTQATAANRIKLYLNGTQVTAFSTATYPSQNLDTQINNTYSHTIGKVNDPFYADYYATEINFIDGQALTPSSFGQTDSATGVWNPIAYTGTYGTNGFYLNFSDNSATTSTTLGKDYSGNGNNWTPNNFSVTAGAGNDSLVDTPTNYGTDTGVGGEVRGNYATWNNLSASGATVTNGNLDVTVADNGLLTPTTFFPTTGKWYCEIVQNSGANPRIGVTNTAGVGFGLGSTANSWAYLYDGRLFTNNTVGNNTGISVATGDVLMMALDLDAGYLWYGKNGVWMPQTSGGSVGVPSTGSNPTQSFTANQAMSFAVASGGGTPAWTANYGQRPFAYTAPTGFKALVSTNLPTPTVGATSSTLAGKYFNPVLYTGNGSTLNVTGVGFQPDWVWAKVRSTTGIHGLFDVVRGVTKVISSDSTAAENTLSGVTAFNSDGFSLGADWNLNGGTYVAWNWKAGGTAVTNTAGTISSQVSANPTAGFSVVTYTGNGTSGATVGHGIGSAVQFIIVKQRGTGGGGDGNWLVGATAVIGWTGRLILNSDTGNEVNSSHWNNTPPTSSVFTLGNSGNVNGSTGNYVAYCFAPVAGYSSFGSYVGNGSADGTFIYTGFRPRYIMIKGTNTNHWNVKDTARSPYNVALANLFPNLNSAETSEYDYDILSNGFKIRSTSTTVNASGQTYIIAAFAESPFNYSRAR